MTAYMDLSLSGPVKKASPEIKQLCARVDVLVNNPGVIWFLRHRLTEEDMGTHLALKYIGHFLLTRLPLTHVTPRSATVMESFVQVLLPDACLLFVRGRPGPWLLVSLYKSLTIILLLAYLIIITKVDTDIGSNQDFIYTISLSIFPLN